MYEGEERSENRKQLPAEGRQDREGNRDLTREGTRSRRKKRENEPEYLRYKRYIYAIIPLIVAFISFFPIGKMATDPARYAKTIAALDEKKTIVMELTAASTASSAAITLIPGDVATPLADKLADMTILGFAAFKILIPAACVLLSAAILQKRQTGKETLIKMAVKIGMFGLAIFLVVPASVKASDMISATYQDSIDSTLEQARKSAEELESENAEQNTSGETEDTSDGKAAAVGEKAVSASETAAAEKAENESWWDAIVSAAKGIAGDAKSAAIGLLDEFQQIVNHLIEALAVLIVTSCLIPILVILFFMWIIRTVLSLDFNIRLPKRT